MKETEKNLETMVIEDQKKIFISGPHKLYKEASTASEVIGIVKNADAIVLATSKPFRKVKTEKLTGYLL